MHADDDDLGFEPAGAPGRRQPDRSEGGDARRRRKRGSRGGRNRKHGRRPVGAVPIELIPGDDDELPELADLPEDAVLVSGNAAPAAAPARARASEQDEETDEDERDEAPRRSEPHKKRVILVNARDSEEKRVAVVEEGRIVDLQMTVRKHVSYEIGRAHV